MWYWSRYRPTIPPNYLEISIFLPPPLSLRPFILPSRLGGAANALSASSSRSEAACLSRPVRSVSMIAITLTAAVARTIKLPIAVENDPTNNTIVASVLQERKQLVGRGRGGGRRGGRTRRSEKFLQRTWQGRMQSIGGTRQGSVDA
jgi:hypothetical protein